MKAATPGPWRVQDETAPPRRSFGIVSHNGREVARYLAFDDHRRFAHTTALPDEVEANAYLIAAAPDMLVLLKMLSGMNHHHTILAAIDAAIAKATGGESPHLEKQEGGQ